MTVLEHRPAGRPAGAGDAEALIEEARQLQRRRRRRVASVAAVLCLLGTALAVVFRAGPSSRPVHAPVRPDGASPIARAPATAAAPLAPWATPGALTGVSCTGAHCAAVGYSNAGAVSPARPASVERATGRALYSADSGRSWFAATLPAGIDELSSVVCTTGACVAVGAQIPPKRTSVRGVVVRSTDWGRTWVPAGTPATALPLGSISCADGLHCVATGDPAGVSGRQVRGGPRVLVLASSDGGRSWTPASVPGGVAGLSGVSCAAATCLAIGTASLPPGAGRYATGAALVLASTDAGRHWVRATTPHTSVTSALGPLTAVACSRPTRCVVAGVTSSGVFTAASVTGDVGHTWQPALGWPPSSTVTQSPDSISCLAGGRCVALANYITLPGAVELTSTDGGAHWAGSAGPNGLPGLTGQPWRPAAVSCGSPARCVAVGAGPGGWMFAASSGNGGTSWRGAVLPVPLARLGSVSCWGRQGCVAVGATSTLGGLALVTGDGGRAWARTSLPTGTPALQAVDCAQPRACVAVGSDQFGQGPLVALVTRDAGTHWERATVAARGAATGLSCTSASTCWIVGGSGLVSDAPLAAVTTNGGRSWRPVRVARTVNGLAAITCTGPASCLALSTDTVRNGVDLGSFVLQLKTANGPARWEVRSALSTTWQVNGITCPTPQRCLIAAVFRAGGAPSARGRVLASDDGGTHWRLLARSPDRYQALDAIACPTPDRCIGVGDGPPNHGAGVITSTDRGSHWRGETLPGGTGNLYGLSCASPRRCIAVGTRPGSATALVSLDGGSTWQRGSLPPWALASDVVAPS